MSFRAGHGMIGDGGRIWNSPLRKRIRKRRSNQPRAGNGSDRFGEAEPPATSLCAKHSRKTSLLPLRRKKADKSATPHQSLRDSFPSKGKSKNGKNFTSGGKSLTRRLKHHCGAPEARTLCRLKHHCETVRHSFAISSSDTSVIPASDRIFAARSLSATRRTT